jgi:hypothetical protein
MIVGLPVFRFGLALVAFELRFRDQRPDRTLRLVLGRLPVEAVLAAIAAHETPRILNAFAIARPLRVFELRGNVRPHDLDRRQFIFADAARENLI